MRITFIAQRADMSGGFRVIATYAKLLHQRGHDVQVVSCPPARPTLRDYFSAIFHRRPMPAVPPIPTSHLDGSGIKHKILNRFRPVDARDVPDADVVIATWWQTAEWVNRLGPEKGAKVYFIQDYEVWGGPKERVDATYRLPMSKITISRWLVGILAQRFDQASVAYVPNSVDLVMFRSPPRGKQRVPTVGFVYSPFRPKGSDVVIEAIHLARRKLPQLKVVCFGSSLPTPELPLPPDFEFHHSPPQDGIKELYSKCDAWLFGTRKEGFGLPILEAMACRTPVIGTPAGAAPQLLEDGGGILIPGEDPVAMADAILSMCNMSAAAWRKLSDTAYGKASHYTWDDASDAFEDALVRAFDGTRSSLRRESGNSSGSDWLASGRGLPA